DGLVRYKALRGLGRLVADHREIELDRRAVERLAHANLVEHLRLLAHRVQFPKEVSPDDAPSRLLVGLLDDKITQSLECTFRLLKIAHRKEDIHRVHGAALSDDP